MIGTSCRSFLSTPAAKKSAFSFYRFNFNKTQYSEPIAVRSEDTISIGDDDRDACILTDSEGGNESDATIAYVEDDV